MQALKKNFTVGGKMTGMFIAVLALVADAKRTAMMASLLLAAPFALSTQSAFARDVDYHSGEMEVYVSPNEPTQIQFPGDIAGGFRKNNTSLSIDRKDSDLIVFATDRLPSNGEAIIVRLQDGRSYSVRIKRADDSMPRDDVVTVHDDRQNILGDEEELAPHEQRKFKKHSPSHVAGLMREMVLAAEFGKQSIPGYRISDRYQGETVLNDGALMTTIDRIFMGPNLWGYVLNATNLLDEGQRLNPATFRLHGTRAISIQHMEVAPRPLNIEQQISKKHRTKIYVITRARD